MRLKRDLPPSRFPALLAIVVALGAPAAGGRRPGPGRAWLSRARRPTPRRRPRRRVDPHPAGLAPHGADPLGDRPARARLAVRHGVLGVVFAAGRSPVGRAAWLWGRPDAAAGRARPARGVTPRMLLVAARRSGVRGSRPVDGLHALGRFGTLGWSRGPDAPSLRHGPLLRSSLRRPARPRGAALISCLSAEEDEIRALPRLVWVLIILFFPLVGGGRLVPRRRGPRSAVRPATWRPGSGFPNTNGPARWRPTTTPSS